MIVSQLALCEECRDGSCRRCKNYVRRQKRKYPHAKKSHIMLETAMKAGMPIVEIRLEASDLKKEDFFGLPEVK